MLFVKKENPIFQHFQKGHRQVVQAIKYWIMAARPKTLIASVAPIFMASALTCYNMQFFFLPFLLTLLAALSIQIGTNFVNDYFDYQKGADTPDRKGPLRVIEKELISEKEMRIGIIVVFTLSAIFSSYLVFRGGALISLLFAISIFFAVIYTAGPFPLAYLGLADPIVIIFFGPIATGFTYYLQTLKFEPIAFLIGLIPGCLSLAILVINNIRDYETDLRANKRTPIVRFGRLFGKIEYTFCLAVAFLFPLIYVLMTKSHICILLTYILLPISIKPLKKVMHETKLNTALVETAQLLMYFSLIFAFGWVIL